MLKEISVNVILCVASISSDRIEDFLQGMETIIRTSNQDKIIVVGLGEPLESYHLDVCHVADIYKQLDNRPRPYAEVMYEKITTMAPFCNEETVAFLIDDDYIMNPNAFRVAKKIFFENPEVNYVSLLKGPGVQPEEIVKLSGIPFFRSHSCMGGSMTIRWKTFLPMVQRFFEKCGMNNQFDQIFWDFIEEETGEKDQVYTIWNCSLIQHCDLGSHYDNDSGHMYGEAYDPRINLLSRS
jgi:hypothetical protein